MKRRDLLHGLAALVPASSVLGHYTALAAPLRKKVKITDLKVMVVGKPGGNTLVRIDTDAGLSGYGEAYWGFGIFSFPAGFAGQYYKKLWWASPVVFVPGTLWRTWGTRPIPDAFC
jgi:hypothetical protein